MTMHLAIWLILITFTVVGAVIGYLESRGTEARDTLLGAVLGLLLGYVFIRAATHLVKLAA